MDVPCRRSGGALLATMEISNLNAESLCDMARGSFPMIMYRLSLAVTMHCYPRWARETTATLLVSAELYANSSFASNIDDFQVMIQPLLQTSKPVSQSCSPLDSFTPRIPMIFHNKNNRYLKQ
jgi:hypothetical protein